jgi:UDP-N-acetylglucosamine transferase subunit ALG13
MGSGSGAAAQDRPMRVFVSVGTDHHPFDRLVEWAERWALDHPDDRVVVQHGTTRPPTNGEFAQLYRRDDMRAQLEAADAVVISCGPGGVMDVRAAGRLPIIVARRNDLGEHVDDHQQSFARHLSDTGLARCVEDEQGFRRALDDARAHPDRFRVEPERSTPAGIARIGELIDELVRGD